MRVSRRRTVVVACMLIALPVAIVSRQAMAVTTAAGALRVQAPGLTFIEGPVMDRLRDGRSVRVDVDLAVLESSGGQTVATATESFTLSFDLWEERFAATRLGTPPRSISHLRARDAEAWCLEQVAIPVGMLGRRGRDTPLWVRVAYRVQEDDAPGGDPGDETGFTLRTLIERLSRRDRRDAVGRSVEGGPYWIGPAGGARP